LSTILIVDLPFLESISAESLPKIHDFCPQNIANTSWAYAKLAILDAELMDAISAQSMRTMAAFRTEEFSITAWAFATLLIVDVPLLASISAASLPSMSAFNNQSIANTAWAFSKLSVTDEPLMTAISAASIAPRADLGPQEMANLAWSLATIQRQDITLIDAISSEAIKKISQFATQNLSNTVWSLATLGVGNPPLMDSLAASSSIIDVDMPNIDQDFSMEEVRSALAEQGFGLMEIDIKYNADGMIDAEETASLAFRPVACGDGIVSGVLMKQDCKYLACLREADGRIRWTDVMAASSPGFFRDSSEFVDKLRMLECFRIYRHC